MTYIQVTFWICNSLSNPRTHQYNQVRDDNERRGKEMEKILLDELWLDWYASSWLFSSYILGITWGRRNNLCPILLNSFSDIFYVLGVILHLSVPGYLPLSPENPLHCTEQMPWKPDSHSAGLNIQCLLWNPKVH